MATLLNAQTLVLKVRMPFPANIVGMGAVQIIKAAGVWQVSVNFGLYGISTPPVASYAHDYAVVWDSSAQAAILVPLATLIQGSRTQRSVTTSPIVVGLADQILNCNIAAAAACTLPLASTRNGAPLTFKDVGGQFGAHNLTLTPSGSDAIDGTWNAGNPLVLATNYQGITLVPANDGVNSGWSIE